ncbi:MAG: hypothetical protein ABIJ47_03725 [Candidatus Bathyarchaeota archaeon]
MKPCKACSQEYGDILCAKLGHCVFEGTGEWPKTREQDYDIHQGLQIRQT